MAEGDNKIEIELALRDSMSAALKEVARNLDVVNRKAMEISLGGAGSIEKFTQHNSNLQESVQRTSRSLGGMGDVMSAMAKSLLGPVGLAAGFVATGKAIENFAESQVQLRGMAVNTGLAVGQLRDLQQAGRRLGMSLPEANAAIATLTAKVEDLSVHKWGETFQALASMGAAGAALGTNMMNASNNMDRVKILLEAFPKQSREAQVHLAALFGQSVDTMLNLSKALELNVKAWDTNIARSDEWHQKWVSFEETFRNLKENVFGTIIDGLSDLNVKLGTGEESAQKFASAFKSIFDTEVMAYLKTTVQEFTWLVQKLEAAEAWFERRAKGPVKTELFNEQGQYQLEGEGGEKGSFLGRAARALTPRAPSGIPLPGDPNDPWYRRTNPLSGIPLPGDPKDPWYRRTNPLSGIPFPGDAEDPWYRRTNPLSGIPFPGDPKDPWYRRFNPLRPFMKSSADGSEEGATEFSARSKYMDQADAAARGWSPGGSFGGDVKPITYTPSGDMLKDLSNTEVDSNALLRDVRDILKRMEDKPSSGREAGEQSTTATYGTGAKGEQLRASIGGFRGVSGGDGGTRASGGSGGDGGGSGSLAFRSSGGGSGGLAFRSSSGGSGGDGGDGGGGGGGGRRDRRRFLGDYTGPGTDSPILKSAVSKLADVKGSEALKEMRAPLIEEINKDPALKRDFLKTMALEEGAGVPRLAAMETAFNRMLMTKTGVRREIHSGFYGPVNRGGLNRPLTQSDAAAGEAALSKAAEGSNIAMGRTDQGMVGDPNAAGPGRIRVPGTGGIFNYWQGKRDGQFYSHEESARFADEINRRAAVDQSLGKSAGGAGANGTLSAEVDFKNVPPWVRIGTEGEGFKTLKVSRSRQAAQAGEATLAPGDPGHSTWSYE